MTNTSVSIELTKGKIITNIRKKLDITRKEFSDALGLSKEEEKELKLWETDTKEVPDEVYKKILAFPTDPPFVAPSLENSRFTQIDLFAGIGGIRLGFQRHGGRTVFSSEWDKFAQKTYRINYGEMPAGDITQIDEKDIPDHDILLAGFPCQPFSQAGLKKGFEDARGTLFFNIAKILREKRPKAFMLENVKQLRGHDKGRTLKVILSILNELNYYVPEPEVLNAYHFGVPQNRERIIIVGFNKDYLPADFVKFKYPKGYVDDSVNVGMILEKEVPDRFTISDKLYQGHLERKKAHKKKGNGFGFCLFNSNSKYTSTISARYYKDGSEALIEQNGKNPRMLTPRECARLQGFPEEFIIAVSNSQAYKQFGNSVCINVIDAVAKSMLDYLGQYRIL
jgi:DNA (cytosine-5)-methyltransferase 1